MLTDEQKGYALVSPCRGLYYVSFPFDRGDLEIFCDRPLGEITEEQMQTIISWAEEYLDNDMGNAMRFAVKQVLGVPEGTHE